MKALKTNLQKKRRGNAHPASELSTRHFPQPSNELWRRTTHYGAPLRAEVAFISFPIGYENNLRCINLPIIATVTHSNGASILDLLAAKGDRVLSFQLTSTRSNVVTLEFCHLMFSICPMRL